MARVDRKEFGKESELIAWEGLEGHWETGSPERHRRTEDDMMGNESKYHRSDTKIHLIECRTGDESGG
jgi:hypothetical protein